MTQSKRLMTQHNDQRLAQLYANVSSELTSRVNDVNTRMAEQNKTIHTHLEGQQRLLTEQTNQWLGELYLNVTSELKSRVNDVNSRVTNLDSQQTRNLEDQKEQNRQRLDELYLNVSSQLTSSVNDVNTKMAEQNCHIYNFKYH
jgi:hypothetical protein